MTFKTKITKAIMVVLSAGLLFVVFIFDSIRKSVELDVGWLFFLREVFVLTAFGFLYLFLETLWKRHQRPVKKLGFVMIIVFIVGTAATMLSVLSSSGFDVKGDTLVPLSFDSVVLANILGVVIGVTMLIVFLTIRDIIFIKQRKGTRRNFYFVVGGMGATIVATLVSASLEPDLLSTLLYGITILAMLLNSFRHTWIVYLTKQEKMVSMLYTFLLFCFFIGFDILLDRSTSLGKSLLFYSVPLRSFITMSSLFGTLYFGMAFFSTLFHLPTAEAFDRKTTEVSSLHNLSKLVTQVFDFNELVDSVTRMTLEVCEAQSAWLEILPVQSASKKERNFDDGQMLEKMEIVSLKNLTLQQAQSIVNADGDLLRRLVLAAKKPIVIDDVENDKLTRHLATMEKKFGSMAVVPLRSHDSFLGILYATKDVAYGFDQDDVDLISAFADHATIAIENSRLIKNSLERERLVREMMVAQEMQKRLLPQTLPSLKEIEVEALSTPAFEVGGDYYDFTMLDNEHLGIIVGDVSGKGVSAAFYMAEMKGIFQSLSKIYPSPKDFLVKAHAALADTIDKKSFISVIYATLNIHSGKMLVARAGHCPMLLLTSNRASYIQPTGMALGMGNPSFFEQTILQQEIQLQEADAVVFFTDGLTEARPLNGEEFGYERLLNVCERTHRQSAQEIRDAIISAVAKHMNHQTPEDDLTIVVIKWNRTKTV
jgi:sigma-B regulation protein RsbU (phosphoserine phosphatase)